MNEGIARDQKSNLKKWKNETVQKWGCNDIMLINHANFVTVEL